MISKWLKVFGIGTGDDKTSPDTAALSAGATEVSGDNPALVDDAASKAAGWSAATRPDHLERFRELQTSLTASVFDAPDPAKTAFFGVAGSLHQQLGLAQKVGLGGGTMEAALRSPFALGYLFGAAAWHSDHAGVPRPSVEAEQLVVAAHREVLGPLADADVAALSATASQSEDYASGMKAAAEDCDALAAGRARGAFGLVQFIAKARAAAGQQTSP